MANATQKMVDLALIQGSDFELTNSGDLALVENEFVLLQMAQNRCLAEVGSWLLDAQYGSNLLSELKHGSPYSIPDSAYVSHVLRALQPMLDDKRLDQVKSVKVLDKTSDTVTLEIQVKIGTQVGTVTYDLNF